MSIAGTFRQGTADTAPKELALATFEQHMIHTTAININLQGLLSERGCSFPKKKSFSITYIHISKHVGRVRMRGLFSLNHRRPPKFTQLPYSPP